MANELYDDYEQSERVRQWIGENGPAIVMGVVLAVGGVFGWRYWQNQQENEAKNAAATYSTLSTLVNGGQIDAAVDQYELLKADYADTPYAAMAALDMAKARLEAGQKQLAVAAYTFAAEHGVPDTIRAIALERKARVQLDMGETDAAMDTLSEVEGTPGMSARLAEIRGDILLAQGDTAAAADAYRTALDELQDGLGNRRFLEMKLQQVDTAAPSGAES